MRLEIGDRVTLTWNNDNRSYPTQVFNVIKHERGVMPECKRKGNNIWFAEGKTYSEQWDDACPLYRAIGWGGNPAYMFLPKPDLRRYKWKERFGWYISQIKVNHVEKLIDKLEAGYRPVKTEELQDLLDSGRILEFVIPKYRGGDHGWKIFPKGEFPEHRTLVRENNKGRYVDFRNIKHEDPLRDLVTRDINLWTAEEKLIDNDLRALKRMNFPAISFNNSVVEYFVRTQVPHTPEEAHAWAEHMWGRDNGHIMQGVHHKKNHTVPPKRKKYAGKYKKYKRAKLPKGYVSTPATFGTQGQARNSWKLWSVRVDNTDRIDVMAKSCLEAWQLAMGMGYSSAEVNEVIAIYPGSRKPVSGTNNTSELQETARLRKRKKELRQLNAKRLVCVRSKDHKHYLRMSQEKGDLFVKDNDTYEFCSKEEWKQWKRGEIKRPVATYFKNSDTKSNVFHESHVRNRGIRPKGKPNKGIPGSRQKITQLVPIVRKSEVIKAEISIPTWYTWTEQHWNKGIDWHATGGTRGNAPGTFCMTRHKHHFTGFETIGTINFERPEQILFKAIKIMVVPQSNPMNLTEKEGIQLKLIKQAELDEKNKEYRMRRKEAGGRLKKTLTKRMNTKKKKRKAGIKMNNRKKK